jgi:hypothetical protein
MQRVITWQLLVTSTSFLKYQKTLRRCSGHHLQNKSVYKKIKANLRRFNSVNHLIRQAIDNLKARKPAVIRIRLSISKAKCLKKLWVKIKVFNQIALNLCLRSRSLSLSGALAKLDCESPVIKKALAQLIWVFQCRRLNRNFSLTTTSKGICLVSSRCLARYSHRIKNPLIK